MGWCLGALSAENFWNVTLKLVDFGGFWVIKSIVPADDWVYSGGGSYSKICHRFSVCLVWPWGFETSQSAPCPGWMNWCHWCTDGNEIKKCGVIGATSRYISAQQNHSTSDWPYPLTRYTTTSTQSAVCFETVLSALMPLVGRQEELSACKSWVMWCWRSYLSGAKCKLFTYGPADATATHHLLLH